MSTEDSALKPMISHVPEYIKEEVALLAKAEGRSVSSMGRALLTEALAARCDAAAEMQKAS